ncbi:Polyamine transporter 4 [Escovopsis weberi]|uniref:Polyamine transporter 4 n=1 Tax=Escovopsis weberi TaxID=150374 RepID=A0A0M8MZM2_ESCWE|nr:Polyamine transporter 4 [Escovopsis weberi]
MTTPGRFNTDSETDFSNWEGQARDGPVPPQSSEKKDNDALDWDGPDDPDNPMNWPKGKKILHTAIPAVYSFALTSGISTFVAAIPLIQHEFHVSREVALLAVSLYTVAFAIGPCIASPLSEIYGRRWIYWSNFPMLVIFDSIAVASNNFKVLVIFRFLAGLGGSGVLAVGAGTLSDMWTPRETGRVGIAYILAPFLGPSIGPLIGAYTLHEYHNEWKWAVWVVLCILAPVGVSLLFMEETSKDRILYLRAKKRGLNVRENVASETLKNIGKGLLRPLHMCTVELLSVCLGLYTAFSFAMVFSFFGSYAYVYSTVYHFNLRQIGLCYIPVIIGFLFAVATFGVFDVIKYQKEVARTNNRVAPEHRLYAALVGCWLVPIGLFWYAWAPHKNVHWIVPVLAGFPFGWGTLANFLSCMAYIVDTYGAANSASAVAANGTLRFVLGAAFPLFIFQVYQNLGIHWAGSLFAFISVAFIPVPWVFFLKGKKLRDKSHYPTSKY